MNLAKIRTRANFLHKGAEHEHVENRKVFEGRQTFVRNVGQKLDRLRLLCQVQLFCVFFFNEKKFRSGEFFFAKSMDFLKEALNEEK